uniref:Uncharacterized protein n=1 Tax=Molossus molossus TaxID=27622 RepID=A0A7J8J0M3_MOLMO|nr:hypothetical protein HJG59_010287 [Molossus molossus]
MDKLYAEPCFLNRGWYFSRDIGEDYNGDIARVVRTSTPAGSVLSELPFPHTFCDPHVKIWPALGYATGCFGLGLVEYVGKWFFHYLETMLILSINVSQTSFHCLDLQEHDRDKAKVNFGATQLF